jgi:hypothetical protein
MKKIFEVTIYPVTPWKVRVEARSEKEAKKKALNLDGPTLYAYQLNPELEEWVPDIMEWPNIGKNGEVYIEEEPQ